MVKYSEQLTKTLDNPPTRRCKQCHKSFLKYLLLDINECSNNLCRLGTTCVNTLGSYYCDPVERCPCGDIRVGSICVSKWNTKK